jgi:hypothetical protein
VAAVTGGRGIEGRLKQEMNIVEGPNCRRTCRTRRQRPNAVAHLLIQATARLTRRVDLLNVRKCLSFSGAVALCCATTTHHRSRLRSLAFVDAGQRAPTQNERRWHRFVLQARGWLLPAGARINGGKRRHFRLRAQTQHTLLRHRRDAALCSKLRYADEGTARAPWWLPPHTAEWRPRTHARAAVATVGRAAHAAALATQRRAVILQSRPWSARAAMQRLLAARVWVRG